MLTKEETIEVMKPLRGLKFAGGTPDLDQRRLNVSYVIASCKSIEQARALVEKIKMNDAEYPTAAQVRQYLDTLESSECRHCNGTGYWRGDCCICEIGRRVACGKCYGSAFQQDGQGSVIACDCEYGERLAQARREKQHAHV